MPCGSSWKFIILLVEVYESMEEHMEPHVSFTQNILVEAAMDGSNGSFHFH